MSMSSSILCNLLLAKLWAQFVLVAWIADPGREVTYEKRDLMPEVLELAQSTHGDCVPMVQVRLCRVIATIEAWSSSGSGGGFWGGAAVVRAAVAATRTGADRHEHVPLDVAADAASRGAIVLSARRRHCDGLWCTATPSVIMYTRQSKKLAHTNDRDCSSIVKGVRARLHGENEVNRDER